MMCSLTKLHRKRQETTNSFILISSQSRTKIISQYLNTIDLLNATEVRLHSHFEIIWENEKTIAE